MQKLKALNFAAAMLVIGMPSLACAEWEADVKTIGFGERKASAMIMSDIGGLAFMCESSAKPMALRITTRIRVEAYEPVFKGTLQLSIDNGEAHGFEAKILQSQANTRLVSAELDAEQAKNVAELLGGAKRTIAFRVVVPSGEAMFSSVVSASGSRRVISRVHEACAAPSTPPPGAIPKTVSRPVSPPQPQPQAGSGVTQTVATTDVVPAPAKSAEVPAPRDVTDLAELTLTPELIGKVIKITVGCMSGSNGVLLRDRTGGLVPVVDAGLSTEEQIAMRRHCATFTNKIELVGTLQKPTARYSAYKHEVKASAVAFK